MIKIFNEIENVIADGNHVKKVVMSTGEQVFPAIEPFDVLLWAKSAVSGPADKTVITITPSTEQLAGIKVSDGSTITNLNGGAVGEFGFVTEADEEYRIYCENPIDTAHIVSKDLTRVFFLGYDTLISADHLLEDCQGLLRADFHSNETTTKIASCVSMCPPTLGTLEGFDFSETLDMTNFLASNGVMEEVPSINSDKCATFVNAFRGAHSLKYIQSINTENQTSTADMFDNTSAMLYPDVNDKVLIEAGLDWYTPIHPFSDLRYKAGIDYINHVTDANGIISVEARFDGGLVLRVPNAPHPLTTGMTFFGLHGVKYMVGGEQTPGEFSVARLYMKGVIDARNYW